MVVLCDGSERVATQLAILTVILTMLLSQHPRLLRFFA
jgi:hypothetical protein